MNNKDVNSIFEQINNLKKPASESKEKIKTKELIEQSIQKIQ